MICASRNARIATIALLMSASFVNGCNSWQAVNAPMPDALGSDRDAIYQVRLRSGGTIHVRDARVSNDSLMGTERYVVDRSTSTPSQRYSERPVKVAVSDVESFSVSRFDAGETAILVVGVLAAILVVGAIAIAGMDWGGSLSGATP